MTKDDVVYVVDGWNDKKQTSVCEVFSAKSKPEAEAMADDLASEGWSVSLLRRVVK